MTDLKNASWPVIKSAMEMNSAWNAWKNIFLNIVDKHMLREETCESEINPLLG